MLNVNVFSAVTTIITWYMTVTSTIPFDDLPIFAPISIQSPSFTYFNAYDATEVKGIQFLSSDSKRTEIVVALNASKVPVRFLSISKGKNNNDEIAFIPDSDVGLDLKKTRIGSFPGGVVALPQYKDNVREITSFSSAKKLPLFGDTYLRSAEYDGKWILLSASSIRSLDPADKYSNVKVVASSSVFNPEKLVDMSLEVVDDYMIQVGQQRTSRNYVVKFFEFKSSNGSLKIDKKRSMTLPSEVLRARPIIQDLSRVIVSTTNGVFEANWDVANTPRLTPLKLKTSEGKQLSGITQIIVDDGLVIFGTNTGVYYSRVWDEGQSEVSVVRCKDHAISKVTHLAISKSGYLIAGFKLSSPNSRLIGAWKISK